MFNDLIEKKTTLNSIIEEDLKPFVKKIDTEAYYADHFLRKLGQSGLLNSSNKLQNELIYEEMELVYETAKTCMTTAFCLWCHLAALTYVRHTSNDMLKNKFLPLLESGAVLGGTGLSNPMKYYAGLEKLHLNAKPTEGGYILSGVLPSVSNLGENHWFGVIAGVDETKQVMCFISCDVEGLKLKEKMDYLGINGSATYACSFNEVFVPDELVLSHHASSFCDQIRPAFISYQIPLGLGVTEASCTSIEKVDQKQNGCNRYLQQQSCDLEETELHIRERIKQLFTHDSLNWKEVARIRLETVYLTLDAVQASMLHNGSSGYLRYSAPSRRLREAYFFANLTPTVKHLEKVIQS